MDKSAEELIASLEVRRLYKALIEQSFEIYGGNEDGFLLYLQARATHDFRSGSRRYSGCFRVRPKLYQSICAELADWGMPGVSERQVYGWVKSLREKGIIATATRRSNKARRGTLFVLVKWSKWDGEKDSAWPDGTEDLQAASDKAFDIRAERASRLPLKKCRTRPDALGQCEDQPGPHVDGANHQIGGSVGSEVNHQSGGLGGQVNHQNGGSYKDKVLKKTKNKQARAREAFSCREFTVTVEQHESMQDAFPWVDLMSEYPKMSAKLKAKGERVRNLFDYVNNWCSRMPVPLKEPDGLDIPAAEACFR